MRLLQKSVVELAETEGFWLYLDIEDTKQPMVQLFRNIAEHSSGVGDARTSALRPPQEPSSAPTFTARSISYIVIFFEHHVCFNIAV